MNLFQAVKERVTARDAAERYGFSVRRNGMVCCPFHADKHPSMKVDARFHCFGCQADGDVIDFTSRLFALSPKEAALKLAQDFSISYDREMTLHESANKKEKRETDRQNKQCGYAECYDTLTKYRHLLCAWREQYAPKTPKDAFDPRFVEAVTQQCCVEAALDTLLEGTEQEKQQVWNDYLWGGKMKMMKSILAETGIPPVYKESAAYAREHGELQAYRDSHRENIACKEGIQRAIADNFDGMHLKKGVASAVLNAYGSERTALVLAATVQAKEWDGRFSRSNKAWAKTFVIADAQTAGIDRSAEYTVTTHPAVLDGFISMVREELAQREQRQERPSLSAQLAQAAAAEKKKADIGERPKSAKAPPER